MKKLIIIIVSVFSVVNTYSQQLEKVELKANYFDYDIKRELVYATTGKKDNNYPYSLVAIDPTNGEITNSVYLGKEPGNFVFTKDTNYLFIVFEKQSVVKKINLETFTIVNETFLGQKGNVETINKMANTVLPHEDDLINKTNI